MHMENETSLHIDSTVDGVYFIGLTTTIGEWTDGGDLDFSKTMVSVRWAVFVCLY